MVEIGRINKLTVKRIMDYGAQLEGDEFGDISLPRMDVPENCQPGDEVEVFVYVDKEGKLMATTKTPKATVGQFAELQVVSNVEVGTFLDWGLEHDLFVPKGEQLVKMVEGQSYVVFITIDEESSRIFASSKLDKFFSQQPPPYKDGEEVDLILYDQTELGYKAVINCRYGGLLYKNEVFRDLSVGQELKGYIKKIREDFKIDLSLQPPGHQKVGDLAQVILQTMKDCGGMVAVNDKSSADEIYALFGVSKKMFKKALGALYKERLVTIEAKGVKLVGQ